jgi:heme oxygenase
MATNRRSPSQRFKGGASKISRDEFTKAIRTLIRREEFMKATSEIQLIARQLDIQFQRIAQIQADLDALKGMLHNRARGQDLASTLRARSDPTLPVTTSGTVSGRHFRQTIR